MWAGAVVFVVFAANEMRFRIINDFREKKRNRIQIGNCEVYLLILLLVCLRLLLIRLLSMLLWKIRCLNGC